MLNFSKNIYRDAQHKMAHHKFSHPFYIYSTFNFNSHHKLPLASPAYTIPLKVWAHKTVYFRMNRQKWEKDMFKKSILLSHNLHNLSGFSYSSGVFITIQLDVSWSIRKYLSVKTRII